jgi:hypothetical protein
MGGWLSRDSSSKLSTADEHHLARKCKSIATAYSKCHKANPNDPKACNNLQTSLVMCYAAGASCSTSTVRQQLHAHTRTYSAQSCRAHACIAQRMTSSMQQWPVCVYHAIFQRYYPAHALCQEMISPASSC